MERQKVKLICHKMALRRMAQEVEEKEEKLEQVQTELDGMEVGLRVQSEGAQSRGGSGQTKKRTRLVSVTRWLRLKDGSQIELPKNSFDNLMAPLTHRDQQKTDDNTRVDRWVSPAGKRIKLITKKVKLKTEKSQLMTFNTQRSPPRSPNHTTKMINFTHSPPFCNSVRASRNDSIFELLQ